MPDYDKLVEAILARAKKFDVGGPQVGSPALRLRLRQADRGDLGSS